MPEAPKQSFFKNLFNLNAAVLDREQLCEWLRDLASYHRTRVSQDFIISNLDRARHLGTQIRSQIWGELVFVSQNNMPDESDGDSSAVSCYKEARLLLLRH